MADRGQTTPLSIVPLIVDQPGLDALLAKGAVACDSLVDGLWVVYGEHANPEAPLATDEALAELGWTTDRPQRAWDTLAKHIQIELQGADGAVAMLSCGGRFEASLLLYTEFWQSQEGRWLDGGDLVAIAPSTDLLLFSWAKIPHGVGRLASALEDCRADGALGSLLAVGPIRFTGEGWIPHVPGPDEAPFVPWVRPRPAPAVLEEPTLGQTLAAGSSQALLFLMWAPLGWRFVEIVGLGGGKPLILACMLPTVVHWVAWRLAETRPWQRPLARRLQLLSLLWASFCLGLMCLHLGAWAPPTAWWAWPTAIAATAALFVEAYRLTLGDGYQWRETLGPAELAALRPRK